MVCIITSCLLPLDHHHPEESVPQVRFSMNPAPPRLSSLPGSTTDERFGKFYLDSTGLLRVLVSDGPSSHLENREHHSLDTQKVERQNQTITMRSEKASETAIPFLGIPLPLFRRPVDDSQHPSGTAIFIRRGLANVEGDLHRDTAKERGHVSFGPWRCHHVATLRSNTWNTGCYHG